MISIDKKFIIAVIIVAPMAVLGFLYFYEYSLLVLHIDRLDYPPERFIQVDQNTLDNMQFLSSVFENIKYKKGVQKVEVTQKEAEKILTFHDNTYLAKYNESRPRQQPQVLQYDDQFYSFWVKKKEGG